MLKRTLFFGKPYHLCTEDFQLKASNKSTGEHHSIPIEDIGFIVFEHPQITFTQSVIQHLAKNNTAVVFCDDKHHPSSMLLHLDTHQIQTVHFRNQINATEPLKKRLWQQTIQQKLRNQAKVLELTGKEPQMVSSLVDKVLSGDTSNKEALAAKRYWSKLLGKSFTRERYGVAPNPALNYGYAILRAAVARALSGSGLLPTFGIHHKNKYNSYCLADDIMEPYRPLVDHLVYTMHQNGQQTDNLGKDEKGELLKILSSDLVINDNKSPLMVGLSQTTASLSRCFAGESKKILYPTVI